MKYYIGLDVSLKETFVSVIDEKGKAVHHGTVGSEVPLISDYLSKHGYKKGSRLGIESGQLSISLCKGLAQAGFDVICVDARHMAAALSARINKNDKNDALGIGIMLRNECYRAVQVKSDDSCELKVMLGSRRQLVSGRQEIMGTIRGLLKIYGIKLSSSRKEGFMQEVSRRISKLPIPVVESINVMLESLRTIEKSLEQINMLIERYSKEDEDCRLLMSIPGVGKITAVTYKSSLDDPNRFKDSATVGAYMGLTPRQYASGEVNRHGSISKMGPKECRSMLYEAAQSLLVVSKGKSKLKSWGLKLAKKKGMKKAIVAVARRLAVIMHRMLVDRTEFKAA